MTLEEIALDIADESETSVIECACNSEQIDGKQWYYIGSITDTEPEPIWRAIGYLKMRRLLKFHPTRPDFVRIPEWRKLGGKSLEFLGTASLG